MTSAERLLSTLRNFPGGVRRLSLTTAPAVDRRRPIDDFDQALQQLRDQGYEIAELRGRGGGTAYRLEQEPTMTLFTPGVGVAPLSAISGDT